jgi:hypothetical protein
MRREAVSGKSIQSTGMMYYHLHPVLLRFLQLPQQQLLQKEKKAVPLDINENI